MIRKICARPGCDDLAEPGGPHCPDHAAIARRDRADAKAQAKLSADAVIGSRLYASRAWRAAARRWLDRNPLCVDCQSVGLVEPAREVDHIKPHRGDRKLFWDRSNWQSLCKSCHSRKTAREVLGGGWVKIPPPPR